MASTFKFGQVSPSGEDTEFVYPRVWARQKSGDGYRLAITPDLAQVETFLRLLNCLPEPYWLLYVLVVPRSESKPGRYQSDQPVSREEAVAFLRRFAGFLEGDARHNVWIASTAGSGQLIYDRHNVIYAYGPLDDFAKVLTERGFIEARHIEGLDPHSHHYNEIFDENAQTLLDSRKWLFSPLHSQDES